MRSIIAFGLALLLLPLIVLGIQLHRVNTGIGEAASYLEIEQPGLLPPDLPAFTEPGIPVLCYHYISPRPGPLHVLRVAAAVLLNLPTLDERYFWSLPVDMFESHMRWLATNGYTTISVRELVEILQGSREAPPKAVCITFDDGERSLLDLALPLLEKYDMTATLFLVTGQVGRDWKGLDMLGWGELAELKASGRVSIESHSHDMHYKVKTPHAGMEPVHRYWTREGAGPDRQRVLEDLLRSRAEIERNLRMQSVALAWPYGFGDQHLDTLAAQAGFAATFSLRPGAAHPDADSPWHIRRFTITARTTVDLLAEMVDAGTVGEDGLDQARMD